MLPSFTIRKWTPLSVLNLSQNKTHSIADIFGWNRYQYISISIGHISIGICYSGYRLYQYRPNISMYWLKYQLFAKYQTICKYWYRYWWPICWCKYMGIGKTIGLENILVSAVPISVQPYGEQLLKVDILGILDTEEYFQKLSRLWNTWKHPSRCLFL